MLLRRFTLECAIPLLIGPMKSVAEYTQSTIGMSWTLQRMRLLSNRKLKRDCRKSRSRSVRFQYRYEYEFRVKLPERRRRQK